MCGTRDVSGCVDDAADDDDGTGGDDTGGDVDDADAGDIQAAAAAACDCVKCDMAEGGAWVADVMVVMGVKGVIGDGGNAVTTLAPLSLSFSLPLSLLSFIGVEGGREEGVEDMMPPPPPPPPPNPPCPCCNE